MEKKKFLIIGTGIALLAIIVLIALLFPQEGLVNVITDKNEYKLGDILKIKVENNLNKNVCFSSCYPYVFERKNGDWESYDYTNCLDSDIVEVCVDSKKIKAFEITIPLSFMEKGDHRLLIPACIGCDRNETFEENQKFYSNDFVIK